VQREPLTPRESGVSSDPDSASPWDVSFPSGIGPPVTDSDAPPPDEPGPLPGEPSPEDPGGPDEAGPAAVPDNPDPPDGAGLIPDDPADDSILGSPTDVFGN
jgi:hypothetical protein